MMDVELYIYDLSNGLARAMSASLIGVQIDAVYHTSIVMDGVEYVYDGNIETVKPGLTHLGRPMQTMILGHTELPLDVIMDYLEVLKETYTPQAYDLWKHNCNSFSNDFAMFLVGKNIPAHITNLPDTVLDSPFGRQFKPMIDKKIKQDKARQAGGVLGLGNAETRKPKPRSTYENKIAVKIPRSLPELDVELDRASKTCAVVFFTSALCTPCRPMYAVYERLARETGVKAHLIKIDIGKCPDAAQKYNVKATPTFISLLYGKEYDRWEGADVDRLEHGLRDLVSTAWPPHPHEKLKLPTLRNLDQQFVLFQKVPPMDKLMKKLGRRAQDTPVKKIKDWIRMKQCNSDAESPLPNLDEFSQYLRKAVDSFDSETLFALVDLTRTAMAEPRFSGFFAEEIGHETMSHLFQHVTNLEDCPYSLQLVALQTACNLFSSPLYVEHVLACQGLRDPLVQLITSSLLDTTHNSIRVVASSLAFNMALANNQKRRSEKMEELCEEAQIELAASLLEAISVETDSEEALKGYLLALGNLIYCSPMESDLTDLLKSMDAAGTIIGKGKQFPNEPLVKEIGKELCGNGLGECHVED